MKPTTQQEGNRFATTTRSVLPSPNTAIDTVGVLEGY